MARARQLALAPPAIVLALGLALAPRGHAATLGEISVSSQPGSAFSASVPLELEPQETIEPSCVSLSRGPAEEGPFVLGATVGIEGTGTGRTLRLRSREPVAADTKLRLVIRCPGKAGYAYREYTSLFTPARRLPVAAAPASSGPVTSAPATPGKAVDRAPQRGLPLIAGDTLESVATAIFPKDREARRDYLKALREANPRVAGLGDREALTVGESLELPDLRSFARSRPRRAAPTVLAESPTRAAAPLVAKRTPTPAPAQERPVAEPVRPAPKAEAARAPAASPPAPRGEFVLKLSDGNIDLSRSRAMNDVERTKLRERLLVMDADDQVAAFLALRDNVRRLESRVAELQLRISGMPPSLAQAPPKPEAPTAPPEPPKAATAPPEAKKPIETAAPAPVPAPAPAATETAPVKPAPKKPTPAAAPPVQPDTGLPVWLWAVVAVLAAAALALAMRLIGRGRSEETLTQEVPSTPASEFLPEIGDEPTRVEVSEPLARRRMAAAIEGEPTVEAPSADPSTLRRRYMEQRFPEIANRTIVTDDPDSVVKAARLFYEDGDLPHATELLQFSTEDKPGEVKTWLALFEIYRLERMTAEFAELAQRFKDIHGKSDYWRKVQYFGREIEPTNALYRDPSMGIETIAFQSGKPPQPETFDPIVENWLNAPTDFENEVLANDLRRALMNRAGLGEEDLAPNPTPALRGPALNAA